MTSSTQYQGSDGIDSIFYGERRCQIVQNQRPKLWSCGATPRAYYDGQYVDWVEFASDGTAELSDVNTIHFLEDGIFMVIATFNNAFRTTNVIPYVEPPLRQNLESAYHITTTDGAGVALQDYSCVIWDSTPGSHNLRCDVGGIYIPYLYQPHQNTDWGLLNFGRISFFVATKELVKAIAAQDRRLKFKVNLVETAEYTRDYIALVGGVYTSIKLIGPIRES